MLHVALEVFHQALGGGGSRFQDREPVHSVKKRSGEDRCICSHPENAASADR